MTMIKNEDSIRAELSAFSSEKWRRFEQAMREMQAACEERGRDDLATATESLAVRFRHHLEGVLAGIDDFDRVLRALESGKELEGIDKIDNRVAFIAISAYLEMQSVKRTGDWLDRSLSALRHEMADVDPVVQQHVDTVLKGVFASRSKAVSLERSLNKLTEYLEIHYGIDLIPERRIFSQSLARLLGPDEAVRRPPIT